MSCILVELCNVARTALNSQVPSSSCTPTPVYESWIKIGIKFPAYTASAHWEYSHFLRSAKYRSLGFRSTSATTLFNFAFNRGDGFVEVLASIWRGLPFQLHWHKKGTTEAFQEPFDWQLSRSEDEGFQSRNQDLKNFLHPMSYLWQSCVFFWQWNSQWKDSKIFNESLDCRWASNKVHPRGHFVIWKLRADAL